MKIFIKIIVTALTSMMVVQAWAQESEDMSFDDVLREFAGQNRMVAPLNDPLSEVRIHLGAGLVSSMTSLELGSRSASTLLLNGFEASLGIDLFSKNWLAEGSIRSFNSERNSSRDLIAMKEFDLKAVYHNAWTRSLGYRLSGGLAARYLSIDGESNPLGVNYSTPASVLSAGLSSSMSRTFSILAEVSFRQALINETPDKSALQASLRLDGHF